MRLSESSNFRRRRRNALRENRDVFKRIYSLTGYEIAFAYPLYLVAENSTLIYI